jgi:protein gp37
MGENSKIEWCDHTFNPWIGCTKVSEGCAHCYAENSTRARVLRHQGHETWGRGSARSLTTDDYWKQPLKWEKAQAKHQSFMNGTAERPRIFCASLADWLDDEVPLAWLARLIDLIRLTPHLDWLLLTKRPQNFQPRLTKLLRQFPRTGLTLDEAMQRQRIDNMLQGWQGITYSAPEVGIENYWIGTTVENQARADERIPQLLSIPAKVRFLSCEPLLGQLELFDTATGWPFYDLEGLRTLHWIIAGGESGPKARPMHPDWARTLRDECSGASVPFLFKQWGNWACVSEGTLLADTTERPKPWHAMRADARMIVATVHATRVTGGLRQPAPSQPHQPQPDELQLA